MLAKNASSLSRHLTIWDTEKDAALYPGSSKNVLAIWITVWCPSKKSTSYIAFQLLKFLLCKLLFESTNVVQTVCAHPEGFLLLASGRGKENVTLSLFLLLSCGIQIHLVV